MTASHRFDESDELRLTIEAGSFAEALVEAGRALGDLVDGGQSGKALSPARTDIVVKARDPAGLLVEWLNELIYRAESEGWLGREFEVVESGPELLRVMARGSAWRERSFPVKAATLDRARVTETAEGVTAEVTLDV